MGGIPDVCISVQCTHSACQKQWVGAKVLCRFEKITALEVVPGNVNVGSLPTINVGQMEGGVVEKFQLPKGANSSA